MLDGSKTNWKTNGNFGKHVFESVGKLEAILTDGLRTLLTTDMTRNIPTLLEYTIRYWNSLATMMILWGISLEH